MSSTESVDIVKALSTPDWIPLNQDDVQKRSWSGLIRFQWLGLTKNMELREIHMALRKKLYTISHEATALSIGGINKQTQRLATTATQLRSLRKTGVAPRMRHSHHFQEQTDDDAAIALCRCTLERLESLLLRDWKLEGRLATHKFRTTELLSMARCPLDGFVEQYIADRDDALEREGDEEMRVELTKAALKGVAGMEILCASLHDRINQNDEMLFKLLLMFVNIFGLIAKYLQLDKWFNFVGDE